MSLEAGNGRSARSSDVDKTTLPPGATEVERRKGNIVRVTTARAVGARCRDCGGRFVTQGGAASHARAARHRVDCDYAVSFVFVPAETVTGGEIR